MPAKLPRLVMRGVRLAAPSHGTHVDVTSAVQTICYDSRRLPDELEGVPVRDELFEFPLWDEDSMKST